MCSHPDADAFRGFCVRTRSECPALGMRAPPSHAIREKSFDAFEEIVSFRHSEDHATRVALPYGACRYEYVEAHCAGRLGAMHHPT